MAVIPPHLLRRGAVTQYATAVMEPYPNDPRLRISGLELTPVQVGNPVQVAFTATDTTPASKGEFLDHSATVTGVVVDNATGLVILTFGTLTINTGPFSGPLGLKASQYALEHLNSNGTLPTEAAGRSITVYVGFLQSFGGLAVNSKFAPNQSVVLMQTTTVPGAPASLPSTQPFPQQGNPIPTVGSTGTPQPFLGLSGGTWAIVGVGGVALAGIVLYASKLRVQGLQARSGLAKAQALSEYAGGAFGGGLG